MTRKPFLLVVEFLKHKDLGSFLHKAARFQISLRIHELLYLAVQIADCMKYLDEASRISHALRAHAEQKRILPRDLAVRNVLLGEGNVVKLGDFGQARYLQGNDTVWKLDRESRLPVRYLGNESLTKKIFSAKSDVWAFGVTMWEILAFAASLCRSVSLTASRFGDVPYKSDGVATDAVKSYVLSGKRLKAPSVRILCFQPFHSCHSRCNALPTSMAKPRRPGSRGARCCHRAGWPTRPRARRSLTCTATC